MPRTKIALQTKTFTFKVESIDEAAGIIKGYLAIFNNIDSKNDCIRPGAFKKTIGEGIERKNKRGKKIIWPILWMHDPEKPLGGFTDAIEDKVGLYVTAQFDIRTNEHGIPINPLAYSTFGGYQMGYVDELSVGYKAIQKSYGNDGVRDLLEMQVFEGSAVTMNFAANDQATATEVKNKQGKHDMEPNETKDFNDYYRQRAIADWASKYYSLTQALKSATMDAFGVGDNPLQDALDALNGSDASPGFVAAFEDWINEGVALDVSNYTKQPDVDSLTPLNYYMSADHGVETKKGAKVSKASSDRLNGHVGVLMQVKDMVHNVAQDLSSIMGSPAYGDDAQSKSKNDRPLQAPINDDEPPASTQDGELDLDALAVYVASELGL